MYGLRFLAVMIGLTVLAFSACHKRPASPVHTQTVAFNNEGEPPAG